MVSEHAMLILMLLLAVAVVVLAVGMMIYASKTGAQLKRMAKSIEDLGAASGGPGAAE